jgi:hypothetical protein
VVFVLGDSQRFYIHKPKNSSGRPLNFIHGESFGSLESHGWSRAAITSRDEGVCFEPGIVWENVAP